MSAPAAGRRAPVHGGKGHPSGTVAWEEHLRAWEVYATRYRGSQSAEWTAALDGFGYAEITALLGHAPKTWEPR